MNLKFGAVFLTLVITVCGQDKSDESTPSIPEILKPSIYFLHINSTIKYRYVHSKVESKIVNPSNMSQEVKFNMVLPDSAFITSFSMGIGDKWYDAFVEEKDKANKEYQLATQSGQTAAHVALSARDSNTFFISLNLGAEEKVNFILTYEELLSRTLGLYKHVINLNPGQIVQDLKVTVDIIEADKLTNISVPPLQVENEITSDEVEKENHLVKIEVSDKSPNLARITYNPSVEDQKELVKGHQGEWGGQLVVYFDVDRTQHPGGQVLVDNGYFVHFFSPENLEPLNKFAIFVLDVSGSMAGKKINQVKEAMNTILNELSPGDYFSIVDFSFSVTLHDLDSQAMTTVLRPDAVLAWPSMSKYASYGFVNDEYFDDDVVVNITTPKVYLATKENIEKAKEVISRLSAGGGTNINDALKNSLLLAHAGIEYVRKDRASNPLSTGDIEPLIVFLTDGDPTVGITNEKKIMSMVKEFNQLRTAIFSLGFGYSADMKFLRKLSLANSGFARTIYEASDSALQLKNFYRQIASPLLANVSFNYIPGQEVNTESITKSQFESFFSGSELVVAGKYNLENNTGMSAQVNGVTKDGIKEFNSSLIRGIPDNINFIQLIDKLDSGDDSLYINEHDNSTSTLEKLWAYLTIKQLLDTRDAVDEDDEIYKKATSKALSLSLKYGFVTPLTSLVVIKPNDTSEINASGIDAGLNSEEQDGDKVGVGTLASLFESGPSSVFSESVPDSAPLFSVNSPPMVDRIDADEESLIQFESLSWFNTSYNPDNHTIALPLGPNNETQYFTVLLNPGTPGHDHSCDVGSISGYCTHLASCITDQISTSLDDYMKFFCPKETSFAGVCCEMRYYNSLVTSNHPD